MASELAMEHGLVQRTLPPGDRNRRDRVADEIRRRQALGHQPMDAEIKATLVTGM